jgi:pimeloyl-ACP methyl ester carboxylesterase
MSDRISIPALDGRALDVWISGGSEGVPLISHHGTPGSGLPYQPFIPIANERGLRHVAYSRPGYGASDRLEGRSIADCAADVTAILDHLGATRCYTIGGSGGGPHALACAALLPDRVIAAATIASVGPFDAPGLDFLAGMGQENVKEFGLAIAGNRDALLEFMQRDVEATETGDIQELIQVMGELLPPVDLAVVNGPLAEHLLHSNTEAFRGGVWGWYDDDLAFVKDWGFDLDAIAVPVALWQGRLDKMVPFAHGEWLIERVPTAAARLPDEHGHLSIAVGSYAQILDDLLALAEGRIGDAR